MNTVGLVSMLETCAFILVFSQGVARARHWPDELYRSLSHARKHTDPHSGFLRALLLLLLLWTCVDSRPPSVMTFTGVAFKPHPGQCVQHHTRPPA